MIRLLPALIGAVLAVSLPGVVSASPAKDAAREAAKPVVAFELLGFRSARFGMTEEEVRKAIAKDFSLSGDAVKAVEHMTERTRVLGISVPDLLPGGGTASVAYVLGHSSKKLIQVGVTWAVAADPTLTPDRLIANAGLLSNALATAGYRPETVMANSLLPGGGGLLVFRGSDAKGRTAALLLQGDTRPGPGEGDQVLTPAVLTLLYVADPDKPDVFTLPPGKF